MCCVCSFPLSSLPANPLPLQPTWAVCVPRCTPHSSSTHTYYVCCARDARWVHVHVRYKRERASAHDVHVRIGPGVHAPYTHSCIHGLGRGLAYVHELLTIESMQTGKHLVASLKCFCMPCVLMPAPVHVHVAACRWWRCCTTSCRTSQVGTHYCTCTCMTPHRWRHGPTTVTQLP